MLFTVLPPVIITHPGDAAVPPGGTLVFSVNVTGENLVYQWYRVVDGGDDMALTDIPGLGSLFGSDTDTLIITDATEAEHERAVYYVIVSNSAGSVTSNTATATVGEFSSNKVNLKFKLCHIAKDCFLFCFILFCHYRGPSSHCNTTS